MIYYPVAGSVFLATLTQSALALSVVRLYQSFFTPNVNTTLAELEAAEADFSGYVAETLTAWNDPMLSPGGGASIASEYVQFQTADPVVVPNDIGGAWIETAGGVLVAIVQFAAPAPMSLPLQGIPMAQVLAFTSGL